MTAAVAINRTIVYSQAFYSANISVDMKLLAICKYNSQYSTIM